MLNRFAQRRKDVMAGVEAEELAMPTRCCSDPGGDDKTQKLSITFARELCRT